MIKPNVQRPILTTDQRDAAEDPWYHVTIQRMRDLCVGGCIETAGMGKTDYVNTWVIPITKASPKRHQ